MTLNSQIMDLGPHEGAVRDRIRALEAEEFGRRLWRQDPVLWKKDPQDQAIIRQSLGWLELDRMEETLPDLRDFAAEVRSAGLRHVVHMGMGGSSLAPLALARILATAPEGLPVTVLDSTDPATILKIERTVSLGETLFIIASKSGTTAEPLAFGEYFYDKMRGLKGSQAGQNFVAVTDPGTPLERQGRARGFRRIFFGFENIGGRYSALSPFGLVPAALMGLEGTELLGRARKMARACGPEIPVQENPGAVLGAAIGELALRGRDKLTLLTSPSLGTLGLWLEQLLAESTGKEGRGVLPIAEEPTGPSPVYGPDRLFAGIWLEGDPAEELEQTAGELRRAGHPVIEIRMKDRLDLAQEFFRWEVATAATGAILGINPFDQPNVQESKDNTNRLLAEVRRTGSLPQAAPALVEGSLIFYGTEKGKDGEGICRAFLARTRPGDYFALQAYLEETPAVTRGLQEIRRRLRDRLGLATTLGYGPRYLHSTGQYHKGGPNRGLFLQLTAEDREDVSLPAAPYTLGMMKRAQALGDLEALRRHGRRALRVHLGGDILGGLENLSRILDEALHGVSG